MPGEAAGERAEELKWVKVTVRTEAGGGTLRFETFRRNRLAAAAEIKDGRGSQTAVARLHDLSRTPTLARYRRDRTVT